MLLIALITLPIAAFAMKFGAAEDRRSVDVEGMVGGQLEEIAAEAVAGHGRDFDRLRRGGRGGAHDQQNAECGEHAGTPRAHAPS